MDKELKCPFCKCPIDMVGNPIDLGNKAITIKCHECGAQGPIHLPGEVYGDVFALWRMSEAATQGTADNERIEQGDFIFAWFNDRDPDSMAECLAAYSARAILVGKAS